MFSYELDNGQIFSETGELRTFGDEQAVVKSGAYSFVSTDGQTYWVNWTADENGFHPIIGKLSIFSYVNSEYYTVWLFFITELKKLNIFEK